MGLQNLYSDLSIEGQEQGNQFNPGTFENYPFHDFNSEFRYGAGSPIMDGVFESNELTFGKGTAYDRPNNGFSNQPFVTSERINTNIVDSFTDRLVRGGIVTATARSIKDVERITKFLLTPQGLGFLTKQVGLQASNPQIREGQSIFDDPASNQRTYNLGVNTLASVLGSAAGIRFKREGTTPLSDPTRFEGYINDLQFTEDNSSNNRLIGLLNDHIINVDSENILLEYNGGPNSVYGLGQTTINKYVNTSIQSQLKIPSSVEASTEELIENELGFFNENEDTATSSPPIPEDPLEGVQDILPPRNIGGFKNKTKRYEARQGEITSYHVSYDGKSDAVNLKEIQEDELAYSENDDFIPFRFEAINTKDPLKSDYIIFRAFLDSFNDNYNANHNEFNYNGRGETFYTYNGFTRNIDFAFKIAAQSKEEILPLYTKLNYLVSNVAPEYGLATLGGRMRTPYIKLTVGDWCNRVPGILNSIALSWQKDYPWQIENSDNILMLPHVLDVSVQFTPIHNFLPEKSIDSHFI